MSVMIGAFL